MTRKKKKVYKFEFSGPRLAMWASGVFLLLAWSFVLGVLVGRGSIPARLRHLGVLKKQLARLEQQADTGPKDQAKPSDKQEVTGSEKFDFFQKLAEKKEEKILPPRAPKGSAPKRATSRERSKPTKSPSTQRYTIQVASFPTKAKAANLVQRLQKKGVSAYYVLADTNKGRYYRVRCGEFSSQQEAVSRLKVIADITGMKGFVCKK
ncbi:MAG TPA: SPOR domain-containing protein [Desulfobacteraceae bacterium]|nr:SPOR domain-containing protein [Desulfobacteraceae bacterium]